MTYQPVQQKFPDKKKVPKVGIFDRHTAIKLGINSQIDTEIAEAQLSKSMPHIDYSLVDLPLLDGRGSSPHQAAETKRLGSPFRQLGTDPQLTGAVQLMKRKRTGSQGGKPPKKATSGFEDTAQNKSGFIYGIWENANFPKKVNENALNHKKCLYAGKVDREPIDRFYEHTKNDTGKPWWIGNGHDYTVDPDCWPYVTRTFWRYKQITKFDVAVAEQFYMMLIREAGGGSCNDRNEITKNKFDDHKDDDDIFTTKGSYPKGWKPVDIFTM